MLQHDQLFPWCDVWDNVRLGLRVQGRLTAEKEERLRALLKNYPRTRFGIYNGNTPHKHSDALNEYHKTHKDASGQPVDPLVNELISREEM